MSSIELRYSRAAQSTDLRLNEESIDIDTIVAAGLCREGLGTLLWRLRTEFDTVGVKEAASAANDQTAMLLALLQLKSLTAAKNAVGAYAIQEAARRNPALNKSPADILMMVPAILLEWINPNCIPCDGRGMLGGYGAPLKVCPACKGRQKIRFKVEVSNQDYEFTQYMIGQLQRKTEEVARKMRQYLK